MSHNIRAIRGGLLSVAVLAALVACAIPACGSSDGNGDSGGSDGGALSDSGSSSSSSGSSGTDPDSGGGDSGVIRPDLPRECVNDCTGHCGPVKDCASGAVRNCGNCSSDKVCSADTHACEAPKISCASFTEFGATGAQCGIVTLSCGSRLKCGNPATDNGCSAGQSCNPDTHQCETCAVTPEDVRTKLGFECGLSPNGCNQNIDLGSCTTGQVCGELSHRCETGPALANIAAFRTKYPDAPSECGSVTNDFGGHIDAPNCPGGQTCGAGGVANRCAADQVYDPCVVEGRQCGNSVKPTACGGGTKFCGACPTGRTCSTNGTCIDPMCMPQTGPAADAGVKQCYAPAPDGCGGNYPAKNCPAADGGTPAQVCLANNTCCQPTQVLSGTLPCTNGDVSNGCGIVNQTCPNTATQVCGRNTGGVWSTLPANQAGNCCTKKTCAADYPNKCGTTLDDGCGGTLSCGINNCAGGAAGNTCDATGTCCPLLPAPSCTGGGVTKCTGSVSATNACGTRTTNCGLGSCSGGSNGNTCDAMGNCCPLLAAPSCTSGGVTKCSGTVGATNTCGTRTTTCTLGSCGGGAAGNTCDGSNNCCPLPPAPSCTNGGVTQCSGMASATNTCGTRNTPCGSNLCSGGQVCGGTATPSSCCTPPTAAACLPAGNGVGVGKECNITHSATNTCTTTNNVCACGNGLQCSSTAAGVAGTCRRTCGGTYSATASSSLGYGGKCGKNLPDGDGGILTCEACGTGKKCTVPDAMQTPGTVYDCVCDPDPSSRICPANYTGPLYDSCGIFVQQCTG